MKTNLSIKSVSIGVVMFVVIMALLLGFIFSGKIILPQFFHLLGIKIYYYGVILATAVTAGYFFARHRLHLINLTPNDFDNIVLTIIITGFIGARLYHVFSSFAYYQTRWSEIFYVWNGGLSIFGAIIGAVVGVFVYQQYYLVNNSFLKILDFLAPSVILGQMIGRFGNLFNYEIYGPPTNLIWKMFVPIQFRLPAYQNVQFFHPLFLYESLACLLILVVLLKWMDLAKYFGIVPRAGQIFVLWLGLYNLERLITESLRIDSPYLFGVKQNYFTAGLLVIVSVIIFIKLSKTAQHEPQST